MPLWLRPAVAQRLVQRAADAPAALRTAVRDLATHLAAQADREP